MVDIAFNGHLPLPECSLTKPWTVTKDPKDGDLPSLVTHHPGDCHQDYFMNLQSKNPKQNHAHIFTIFSTEEGSKNAS